MSDETYEQCLLQNISWIFSDEKYDDENRFLKKLIKNQEYKGALNKNIRKKLSLKKMGIIYDIAIELHKEKDWSWLELENIMIIESKNHLTEFDILFHIQKEASILVSRQDHRFFEGLVFEGVAYIPPDENRSGYSAYPIYRMHLGS